MDLSNEKVAESTVDFGVGDVDHVLVDVKVNLKQKNKIVKIKISYEIFVNQFVTIPNHRIKHFNVKIQ